MADASLLHLGTAGAFVPRLLHTVKQALIGMWEGYAAHRMYQILNSLSDTQLEQIGLKRGEIGSKVLFPVKRP